MTTRKSGRELHQTSVYLTTKMKAQLKLAAAIKGTTFTEFMTDLAEREIARLSRQDRFSVLKNVGDDGATHNPKTDDPDKESK